MIKLTLPPRPAFLTDEFVNRQTEKYKADNSVRVWDIKALKEALLTASHNKCSFSEVILNQEGKYMQVEHFYPKSKYPEKVLEWGNLLPCLNVCNSRKRDLDPSRHPMVNPFFDNPKDFFYIENGRICVLDSKNKKAVNTLEAYDLNNPGQLRIPRLRSINKVKEILLMIKDTFPQNTLIGKNRLKAILRDCGKTYEYSAAKSTAVLEDNNYRIMKEILTERGEWDEDLRILEEDLIFCSLPKPPKAF
ncbi:MAG: hypothetical protein K2I92_05900 [Muribaculaceae bacterium]|nr:hypothetical protein [Muribaculaceae bacterium]